MGMRWYTRDEEGNGEKGSFEEEAISNALTSGEFALTARARPTLVRCSRL